MSVLAAKLFEERELKEQKKADYRSFLNTVLGEGQYDPALNENADFQQDVQETLMDLCESNPLGGLQWYVMEEHFIHGKSKEEIGKEIADNMDLLLQDLINSSARFIRHPKYSRVLKSYTK